MDHLTICGISIKKKDNFERYLDRLTPVCEIHNRKKSFKCTIIDLDTCNRTEILRDASEATRAVRDWIFKNTPFNIIYSYMKYTNVSSYRRAMAYVCIWLLNLKILLIKSLKCIQSAVLNGKN